MIIIMQFCCIVGLSVSLQTVYTLFLIHICLDPICWIVATIYTVVYTFMICFLLWVSLGYSLLSDQARSVGPVLRAKLSKLFTVRSIYTDEQKKRLNLTKCYIY